MKVEASYNSYQYNSIQLKEQEGKQDVESKEPLSGKSLSEKYLKEYMSESLQFSSFNFKSQNEATSGEPFSLNLEEIGYTGKPIAELSQQEAKELVSEDGFFGIAKTAERIADFVINGAGDDLQKLQAGKEGMLQGFKEAEQMWGDKLPDISYETMQKALEKVDARITELGGSVLDTSS